MISFMHKDWNPKRATPVIPGHLQVILKDGQFQSTGPLILLIEYLKTEIFRFTCWLQTETHNYRLFRGRTGGVKSVESGQRASSKLTRIKRIILIYDYLK